MKKNRLIRRESALKVRSKNLKFWQSQSNPHNPTNKEQWADFEEFKKRKVALATKEVAILNRLISGS